MKLLHKHRVNRSTGGNIAIFIVLLLFAAFMVIPFVYAVVQAFKPMEELFIYPPRFFVRNPTLDNFKGIWRLSDNLWVPFSRYVFNSVFVTVVGIALSIVIGTVAAFPLAKYDFPGNKFINQLIVMSLLFSGPVTALPQFIIIVKLGLFNNLLAVILPIAGGSLTLFLMRNFMSQIPDAVIEAATIDGASRFTILYRVCLPLVKPAMLTVLIFSFQTMWNAGSGAYITAEDLKLLPTMLGQIATGGIARTGVGSATSILMMVPLLVVFVLLQARIVETMAYSGIKE